MVTSTSRLAFADCYDLLDKALEAPDGIRFAVSDIGLANQFRVRLHTARRINREDNKDTYDKDHPLYGRSIYDTLVVRIREIEGKVFVYITKVDATKLNIEVLNGDSESSDSNMREVANEATVKDRRF
jgi:hypothetical protein